MAAHALHTIRGVAHIVSGGSHDDQAKECSFRFWRCGKGFAVSVAGSNVEHTTFHHLWLELVAEDTLPDLSRLEKWFKLCDLILNECQGLLAELAPAGTDWTTLRDYLHCPTYTLSLIHI